MQVCDDRLFPRHPLLKAHARSDRAPQDMEIPRVLRGTSVALTPEEWSAVEAWLAGVPD